MPPELPVGLPPLAKPTNPKDLIGTRKPPIHLIPPVALIHAAEAHRSGAEKYGPYNWREKGVRATVYVSAAMRHLLSYLDGQTIDPESGVPALAHVIASCAILLDAHEIGNLVDDRPLAGMAPIVLERYVMRAKP